MKHLTQLAILIASVLSGSILQGQVPQIISSPSSQTVAVGSSFQVKVIATGANLTYQWWIGNTNSILSGTNSTYTVSSAAYSDGGDYTVVVGSDSGSVVSSAARITVLRKPAITTGPSGQVVAVGTNVTLNVVATGDLFSYQWLKDGTNIPGANASSYALPGAATNNSATYSVMVSNAVGTATSSGAVVQFLPVPVLTTSPTNAYVATGASYTLVSAASGGYLSYQWAKGGVDITDATNATYNIPVADPAFDSGSYRVTVTNLAGSVNVAATITVLDVPAITINPASTNVATNTAFNLTVTATGGAPLHYQWLKGATNVGSDSATLALTGALTDAATYSVVVSNSVGKVTSPGAVVQVVSAPLIITQPLGKTNAVGSSYTFTVVLTNAATSLLNYQWKVDTGSGATNIPGATASTLPLTGVDTNSSGTYSVVVTNLAGSVTSSNALYSVLVPPTITTQPVGTNVATNTSVTLTVAATGDLLTYQWRVGGTNIVGSNGTTLTIAGYVTNSGIYSVVVSNAVNKVTSGNASVLFVAGPQIITQPADKGVKVGDSATFTVVLTNASTSLLNYQWYFNGTSIPSATGSSYTLNGITNGNGGSYSVRVTNIAGSVTSSAALLTVQTAPAISVQPISTNIAVSSNLSLSVTASGGLLGYIWRSGSNIVAGATNSTLLITNAQTTNSGTYTVTVTNAAGSAVSGPAVVWVVAPPVILTNPATASLIDGVDYTMSVAMQDPDTSLLAYQWYWEGQPLDGETTPSLFFSSVGSESDGHYLVVVTNVAGVVTSTVATLTVQTPPAITVQPQSTNIGVGTNFAVTVTATGDTLFYQWRKNGVNVASGFGSNSYSVTGGQVSDSGTYTVVVSNLVGTVASSGSSVLVVAAPVITTQPITQTLYLGNDATFTVGVSNATSSMLSYQWLLEGAPLLGQTSSTLTLHGISSTDQGHYSVTVTNLAGTVTSASVLLTVLTPPQITSQPVSTNVPVGSNIVLSVTASGQLLTYEWYRGATALHVNTNVLTVSNAQLSAAGSYSVTVSNALGKVTSSNALVQVIARPGIKIQPLNGQNAAARVGTEFIFSVTASNAASSMLSYQWVKDGTPISGATTNEYDILAIASSDSGSYTVVITNIAGAVTSSPVTLTVQAWPVIMSQPTGTNVGVGTNVVLSVGATGDTLAYQWRKNGTAIGGANAATYTITGAAVSDSATYSVAVTNLVGSAVSAGVNVLVVGVPVIQTPPTGSTVIAGSDYTFSVVVSNAATSLPNYQWLFNSNAIPGSPNSASYTVSGASPSANAGYYSVVVTNLAGAVTSAPALLQVQTTPSISLQPASTNVGVGTNISFVVTASGNGLAYQWKKGITQITGATNSAYTITGASLSDAGSYTVVITNIAGSAVSIPAVVQVVRAPVITNQPASQTLPIWSDCTFTVGMSNAATSLLTYQWYYNGNAQSGQTNASFLLSGIVDSDYGNYLVVVTNIAGAVTSSVAVLTVEDIPTIQTQPQSTNIAVSSNLVLSVAASGNALHYQWKKGTNVLGGATSATYTINNAQISDSGSYTVRISNDAGTNTSDPAVLQVVAPPLIVTQPISAAVAVGDGCAFSVVMSNANTSLLTYQWYVTNSTSTNAIDNATSDTLELGGVASSDMGGYFVVVTNVAGSVTSSVANLLVQIYPFITTQPGSSNYAVGDNISHTVVAGGDSIGYNWYKGPTLLGSQTTSNLTINGAATSDSGTYSVVITNAVGAVTSAPVTVLVVGIPTIGTQPIGAYVGLGTNYTMSVGASGGLLTYQWLTNGAVLAGANSSSYVLAGVGAYASNSYSVGVSNLAGGVVSTPISVVVEKLPSITNQPTATNVAKASTITLTVGADGDALVYQWFKGNNKSVGGNTNSLVITNAQTADTDRYFVVVSNDVSSVTSSVVNVQVVAAPAITTQPLGTNIVAGSVPNYTFTVHLRSETNSLLTYQWYAITNGSTNAVGGNTNYYTITSPGTNHTGQYFVWVTNLAGFATSSLANLQVQTVPTITNQPAATNIPMGNTISLTVGATGESIGYIWFKGTNINNVVAAVSTNTLVITNSQLSDSGSYSVLITNAVGSITSTPAAVLVVAPPVITQNPVGRSLVAGYSNITFHVAVSNASISMLHYQWKQGAVNVGTDTNALTLSNLAVSDSGDYTVVVTNIAGATTSTPAATLTVQHIPVIALQPASTNVGEGTNFTLGIVASVGEGMGIQWMKDGLPITGAVTNLGVGTNSTYVVSGAAISDTGSYSVVITNAVATVVSSNAMVKVVSTPVISSQPISREVAAGTNYTFSVQVTNTDSSLLRYQWYFNTNTLIANATNNSYRIGTVRTNDGGVYSVIVTNVAGSATSSVASLVVMTMPSISVQPASTNLAVGGNVILTVQATGGALTYVWKKGTNILSETSNTLTITSADTTDSGSYTVTVANKASSSSSVTSTPAVVNVVTAPIIATPPQGKTIAQGGTYTFSVIVTNTSLLSYRWIQVTNNPDGTNVLAGATNSTLRLTSISTNNSGDYYVVVTNLAGGVTSTPAATLIVQTTPTIVTNPASTNLIVGSNLVLNVQATGVGITYQWTKGVGHSNILGANTSTLVISNAQTSDSGLYSVIVTNTIGSVTSSNANVYVVDVPVITTQPQGRPIAVGSAYTFSVVVSNAAYSALTYQWMKGGSNLVGQTSSYLKLQNLTVDDSDDYSVLITNVAGSVTSSNASLTVMAAPTLTLQPVSTSLPVTSNLVLTADATGGYLTYIWRKGTNVIPNSNTNVLTILNASVTNSGQYSVLVTNSIGSRSSTNVNVLVVAPPVFQTTFTNASVGQGSSYTFTAVVTNAATSLLTYQWFKDGTNVAGATNNTLKLTQIASSNAGTYLLWVTNIAGAATNSGALTVLAKPAFTTDLSNTNLAETGNINLTVAVSGQSLVYQWRKGTAILTGATNATLLITNVHVADSGTYSVKVTNSAGVLTSSNSIVTVVAAPAFQKQPVGKTVVAGTNSTYTFSVTMSNAASSLLTYQWVVSSNSPAGTNVISGATTNSLKLTGIGTNNAGSYYVIVTNLAGAVTSSPAVLVVQTLPQLTNNPTSTNIAVGTSVTLVSGANGSSVRYQWRKGTAAIRGATNSSLTISTAKVTDSGTYSMVASNSVGIVTSSNAVVLVVNAPAIQTQPQGRSLVSGVTYTMTVTASNATSSALTYQWCKTTNYTPIPGAITSTLRLANVTTNDTDKYSVIITNVAGAVTSSLASIIVQATPVITNQPAGTNMIVGNTLTMSVGATGDNLYYKWVRGTNIVAAGYTNATLTITNAQMTNSGIYSVTITNNVGKAVSSSALVMVVDVPTILTNITDTAVASGGSYTFKVVMANSTNSLLHYNWFFNGNPWPVTKATNSTLALTGVTTANQGTYQVVITNIAGAVTSTAYMTVQARPVITVQPKAAISVTNGMSVTLSVTATGDSLVYQWRKMFGSTASNIVGATSSTYVVNAAATNDAGVYSVLITNLVGSVTSSKSAVTVLVYNGSSWIKYNSTPGNTANESLASSADSSVGDGDYTGLFVAANGVPTHQTAGLLSASVTSTRSYSGKLWIGGDVIGISGQFSDAGTSAAEFARPGKSPITVSLVLNSANQQLSGSVSSVGWTSVLTADRSVFDAANPAPNVGSYSVVIPATEPAEGLSATGSAFVNANGKITFVATTSEGKTISQSTTVSKAGYWPFYVPYGDGEIIGWLQFVNGRPVGTLNWINSTGTETTVSEVTGADYAQ